MESPAIKCLTLAMQPDAEAVTALASSFLSPKQPPSVKEVQGTVVFDAEQREVRDMTREFDAASGVCKYKWDLPAKEFTKSNITKTSKEFQVFFGKSLTFQICLTPKDRNWRDSKGVGSASLKNIDDVKEQTMVKFRFSLGSADAKQHEVLNDFSVNSQKHAEQELNFSSAAAGPRVVLNLEFLPCEPDSPCEPEPGWQ